MSVCRLLEKYALLHAFLLQTGQMTLQNLMGQTPLGFVQTVSGAFAGDTRGKKIGIGCRDDISGELTLNVGRLQYEQEKGGEAHINIRYPVTEADADFFPSRISGKSPANRLNKLEPGSVKGLGM